MEDTVQKLQKELFACRSTYATAQRSVVQLSSDLKDAKQEIEMLKRSLHRHQDNTAALRASQLKVEELEGSLLAQQRQAKLLQSARVVLDEEITALRTENTSKSYEIASLQQSIALQKSKLEEQSSHTLVLKSQIAELEDDVAAAENDARTAREALRDGSRSHNTDDLSLQIENLTSERSNLFQQLAAVKAERDQLQNSQQTSTGGPVEPSERSGEGATVPSSVEYTPNDVDRMGEVDLRPALHHCLRLQEQYKHARDSLLSANRHESLQAERLRHDVEALASSLKDSESCSNAWQAQCMSALDQIDRLKEMLSEGAEWVGDDGVHDDSAGNATRTLDVTAGEAAKPELARDIAKVEVENTGSNAQHCRQCANLQQLALRHAEKATSFELQLRAMCAEMLRNTRMAGQIGRSTLPMLYSIESRLLEMSC
eukprot:jgi/Ulvmu1/7829/UM004_0058.1